MSIKNINEGDEIELDTGSWEFRIHHVHLPGDKKKSEEDAVIEFTFLKAATGEPMWSKNPNILTTKPGDGTIAHFEEPAKVVIKSIVRNGKRIGMVILKHQYFYNLGWDNKEIELQEMRYKE